MATVFNIPSAPHNTFSIFLDGKQYQLTFRWSSRTSKWFMDMFTYEGVPITVGVAVLPDTPLINKSNVLAPSGQLFLIKQDSSTVNPTRFNIGIDRSFELAYFTVGELS